MGGKSSNSSSQADNTSYDNRAIQQEENSGIQILGEGNTVHSTTTDHGAMDAAEEIAQAAGDLGKDAFNTAEDLGQGAFDAAEDLGQGAFDVAKGALNTAEDLGKDAFNTAESLGENVMGAAVDLATISAGTTSDSFDFAESVALDSLDGMQDLSSDVIDRLAQSNFDNTQVIAGISAGQQKSSSDQLKAIAELAKSTQTGGATEISKQQTKTIAFIVVGVVVTVGLLAVLMRGKK